MSSVIGSSFIQICIDDSANRIPDNCRIIVEGPMGADGTASPNTLFEVTDPDQFPALFGAGTVISEGLKVAMDCCRSDQIEIYALPRADAGTAAVYEGQVILAGTATELSERGRLNIYWGEARYSLAISAYAGQTPVEIAAAIVAAVPYDFLFTATAGTDGAFTLTAKNGGQYGNELYAEFEWVGRTRAVTPEVSVALTQTTLGVGAYARHDDYRTLLGEACCACCLIHLSDDSAWQTGALEYIQSTWDCDEPNCMTMGYTYASGTVESILGYENNWTHSAIMAHCNADFTNPSEGDAIFPWMKIAAYGAKSCCIANTSPEQSIEGRTYGALDCVSGPSTCAPCFDYEDRQELADSGFVTTSPIVGGSGFMTSPYIDKDISEWPSG